MAAAVRVAPTASATGLFDSARLVANGLEFGSDVVVAALGLEVHQIADLAPKVGHRVAAMPPTGPELNPTVAALPRACTT